MTGILFKALPSLKARAANCRARARMFRERARSSPKDDLRTACYKSLRPTMRWRTAST